MAKQPQILHYLDTPADKELFLHALEEAFATAKNRPCNGHLLLIRVDNLPMILSAYDNKTADRTINLLRNTLGKYFKDEDKIYRITYNQLALIMLDKEESDIERYAEFIFNQAQNIGFHSEDELVHITISIGSSIFPNNAHTSAQAINNAFIALTNAQQSKRHFFTPYIETEDQRSHSKNQMILANFIQHAMREDRLCLAFQPIINSRTNQAESYESLLRIKDEKGKIISAGPFIPLAEQLGFIEAIDRMVFTMVLEELESNPDIQLSLNVSNVTVNDPEWLNTAISRLQDPSIAKRLTVEITETAIQDDFDQVLSFIKALHELGCTIALDDFGVGYTSFRQLKSLPIDVVKIDGYFVKDMVDNNNNRLFVKTLLDFAKAFGLKAVAEYVENEEIANLLREFDVDYMQGNYFCPAVNYRCWEAA